MTALPLTPATRLGWNLALWAAQALLAALYLMAARMHLTLTPAELAAMGAGWALEAPLALVRFIGLAELLGAIGLLLPAATRIQPRLTVLAAGGLLAIQAFAIPLHLMRGEVAALPFNLVYVTLAVFILWGRTRVAPIRPRRS